MTTTTTTTAIAAIIWRWTPPSSPTLPTMSSSPPPPPSSPSPLSSTHRQSPPPPPATVPADVEGHGGWRGLSPTMIAGDLGIGGMIVMESKPGDISTYGDAGIGAGADKCYNNACARRALGSVPSPPPHRFLPLPSLLLPPPPHADGHCPCLRSVVDAMGKNATVVTFQTRRQHCPSRRVAAVARAAIPVAPCVVIALTFPRLMSYL
jgi:hypothetical protein